ncbi:hypothetical protein D3C73_1654240 [compost metagenome]
MFESLVALFMLIIIHDFNSVKLCPEVAADVAQINFTELGAFRQFLFTQAAAFLLAS